MFYYLVEYGWGRQSSFSITGVLPRKKNIFWHYKLKLLFERNLNSVSRYAFFVLRTIMWLTSDISTSKVYSAVNIIKLLRAEQSYNMINLSFRMTNCIE